MTKETSKEEMQQHIENMEKELKKMRENLKNLGKKSGVFIPEEDEYYWCLDNGCIYKTTFIGCSNHDVVRKSIGNCFRTKEDAERYKRALITKRKLELLADRLNDGRVIDWKNGYQIKFCISLNCRHFKSLETNSFFWLRGAGVVYCLDKNFLEKAKKEIGEEALIEYIESGV